MMETDQSPLPNDGASPGSFGSGLRILLLTGFIAGVLDLLAAFAYVHFSSHHGPMLVLKFISSGVFGIIHALAGGQKMAIYGLIIHFSIAYFWTVFFFICYPVILKRFNFWLNSVIIGCVIWIVMNLIALPLSRVPHSPLTLVGTIGGIIVLIIAVGIPVSLGARRAFK